MSEQKLGKSSEDYLEAIRILKEKNSYVRSVDIAAQLGVTKPSVSVAVKRLKNSGYIYVNESGFISLTSKGELIAEKIYARHRILSEFFIALGVNQETALEDACKIEHDISEETFAALCKYLEKQQLTNFDCTSD